MRAPDGHPNPLPRILTLRQHREAGLVIVSHCSADPRHTHIIDIDAAIANSGDAHIDQEWQRAQTCPTCGAPGGGLTIRTM